MRHSQYFRQTRGDQVPEFEITFLCVLQEYQFLLRLILGKVVMEIIAVLAVELWSILSTPHTPNGDAFSLAANFYF